MMNPVSLSSESLNVKVILEILTQPQNAFIRNHNIVLRYAYKKILIYCLNCVEKEPILLGF